MRCNAWQHNGVIIIVGTVTFRESEIEIETHGKVEVDVKRSPAKYVSVSLPIVFQYPTKLH